MQKLIKKHSSETADAIADYLARNPVTQCKPGATALKAGQLRRATAYGCNARGHADRLARAATPRDSDS